MKIKKINNNVKIPTKAHQSDVGLDLFMPSQFDIEPFETKVVGLGIAVSIPEGFAGMLVPRSSVAAKGLIVQTSIIDPGYTGEIHLILTNCSKTLQHVDAQQRVCSLVMFNSLNAYIDVDSDVLCATRGDNGLGSSGK